MIDITRSVLSQSDTAPGADAVRAVEPLISGAAPVLWSGFAVFVVIFLTVLVLTIRTRVITPARQRALSGRSVFEPAGDDAEITFDDGPADDVEAQQPNDDGQFNPFEGEENDHRAPHDKSPHTEDESPFKFTSGPGNDSTLRDDAQTDAKNDNVFPFRNVDQPSAQPRSFFGEPVKQDLEPGRPGVESDPHDLGAQQPPASSLDRATAARPFSGAAAEKAAKDPMETAVHKARESRPDPKSNLDDRDRLFQAARDQLARDADELLRRNEAAFDHQMQSLVAISRRVDERVQALAANAEKIQGDISAKVEDRMIELAEKLRPLSSSPNFSDAASETNAALIEAIRKDLAHVANVLAADLKELRGAVQAAYQSMYERIEKLDVKAGPNSELSKQLSDLNNAISERALSASAGRLQLAEIVRAVLPAGRFAQAKRLATGRVADFVVSAPNGRKPIAIDARFPIDAYDAYAKGRTQPNAVKTDNNYRRAVLRHIVDISTNLIVPGETADAALMFVPSEIIFNDLHANFKDVVQDSYRARVWIVSPTSLMATLNAVGAITEAVEPTDDTRMKSYNTAMSAQIDALSERVRQLESNAGSAAHDEAANSSDTPAEAIEQDERSLHETSSDIEKPE